MKTWEQFCENRMPFVGTCSQLRRAGGESEWHKMVKFAQPVSQQEFLKNVDLTAVLDEDETPAEWMANHSNLHFFNSFWGNIPCYLIGTAGFEFVFAKSN